ncbi:MAG: PAS domain-containing protein [Actinobacteria bacterium]|nr:PAS domain-containing protein [Actinomycetota bacterium]MBW3651924.1 PAS domain-containing protein [Actinomycetota bacterium]
MQEGVVQYLAQVLRGLSGGAEPVRLLSDTLAGAVAAASGRHGIIVGMMDGALSVVAATGTTPRLVMETAQASITEGRLTRGRDQATGSGAIAAPVRVGQRIVGAIAVGGDPLRLDGAPLPLFADAAGLALARRPSAGQCSVEEFSESLVHVATDLDQATVMTRIFEAAGRLFGALGGFCVVPAAEGWRVAHYQGITAANLRAAAQHPDFRAFVASANLRVEPPNHPVVAGLATGTETAVSVPLVAAGRRHGFLVLLLCESPSPAAQSALRAFADHAAMTLRSSELAQRLRDHEQRLAAVVHSSPNPVVLLDDRGQFVLVNGAAAELFHLPEAFAVGQPVAGRLGHEALERLVAEEGEGQLEVALGTPPDRLYLAVTRRMRAGGGRDLGRILVLQDVTKERETDKLKNDFVSVIGHELRTPLTVVKGYVKMLARRGVGIDEASLDSVVTALSTNTARLERLIEDLLFVSAIESRRPTLDLQPVDIGQVLDEFGEGRVVVKRPRRPIAVQLDRQKLDQILHHLLDNALKYTDGEIVINVVDGDEDLEIQVDDSGPGIYSGDLPNLFERFRQLDGSSTRVHGGTGLGLYICRRLVELQGGRIWCESRLGVGSRFAFTLPKDGPVPART